MNEERRNEVLEWFNYEVGFTGMGPTKLDEKPLSTPPNEDEKRMLGWDEMLDAVKNIRKGAFREACIEVLGEDPDDWY